MSKPKINDGLTNTQRYRLRHLDKVRAATLAWYHKNKGRAKKTAEAWRLNNPEKYAASKRKWRERNHDLTKTINRNYYARHRERKAAEKREWRKAHPEEAAAIKNRWMARNPEKTRESQIVRKIRRRAVEYSAEGEFGACCIGTLYRRQFGLCYYCAASIENGYEVDHKIPLVRGGLNSIENLALACRSCNRSKGAKIEGWGQHWVHHQG